jgi:MraZ protein
MGKELCRWLTELLKWVSLGPCGSQWDVLGRKPGRGRFYQRVIIVLLTGCYRRTLDDKSRLAIPKQLRDLLGFPQESSLYIAPGTDRALEIYTSAVLERIGQSLSKLSQAAKDTRAFSRLFYAQAQPAEVDRQGRLRVPPELASLAGITNEVMVLGVRDRIELWDPTTWEQFLAQNQSSYDQLAESVLGQAAQTEN